MIKTFFNFLIDLIFPPTKESLELRTLSPSEIYTKLPPAPHTPHPLITSLFAYKNPLVSELVWSIKYKKDRHAVECGGFTLHKKICDVYKDEKIILIPIPISKERRRERGYNQCELLIDEIVRLDRGMDRCEKRFDILVRIRNIDRQTLKGRKERLKNTEHIFKAERVEELLNRRIVIIDDVVTTGSTLVAAYDALREAGYTDVTMLTLAH